MSEQQKPLDLIFDWETAGNKPHSAVASIALIVFDPAELLSFDELVAKSLRIKFKMPEQFSKFGRTYDQDTIDWWKKPENAEAYKMVIEVDGSEVSLSEMGPIVQAYLDRVGYVPNIGEKIWTRGNSFDPPIFSHIYEYFGWEEPYPWWNVRDVRSTIDAIVPYWDNTHEGYGYIKSFPYPEGFIKHKEEHDCARDILMMQHAHIGLINYMNSLIN